jgi:hypothetical protein
LNRIRKPVTPRTCFEHARIALGGSCAYNLRLAAWDRHTNGFAAGTGWSATHCEHNRAFTVILA